MPADHTVAVAKVAVQTGMWLLHEVEDGVRTWVTSP